MFQSNDTMSTSKLFRSPDFTVHVLAGDFFYKVVEAMDSPQLGFQHDVAVLHLDLQIVLGFESNLHRDTLWNSNRQTVPPLVCRCFHVLSSRVDMGNLLSE